MHPQHRFAQQLLAENLRPDGREPLTPRQSQAHFLPQAGHLLFLQGNTQLIIKAKAQITAPRNERPSEGFVFFRVDCSATSRNHQEQKKVSTQLCKLLETVVVGSKALDPESLCILSGRFVWKVSLECLVCSDDGNLIDCVLNGAIMALMDLRKPLVRLDKEKLSVESEIQQSLSLAHIPVSLTFALTEQNILADPSGSEEAVVASRVTVSLNIYKQICSIHKPGGLSITQETLTGCLKLAEKRVKESTEWIRQTLKQRPLLESSF